jgi:hypothetical protein
MFAIEWVKDWWCNNNEKCLGSVFEGDCVTNLMQKKKLWREISMINSSLWLPHCSIFTWCDEVLESQRGSFLGMDKNTICTHLRRSLYRHFDDTSNVIAILLWVAAAGFNYYVWIDWNENQRHIKCMQHFLDWHWSVFLPLWFKTNKWRAMKSYTEAPAL